MGEGSTSIKKVGVRYSESIKLCVKMKDKRGKPKGRVELELQIDPKAVLTPSPVLSTDVSYQNHCSTSISISTFISTFDVLLILS